MCARHSRRMLPTVNRLNSLSIVHWPTPAIRGRAVVSLGASLRRFAHQVRVLTASCTVPKHSVTPGDTQRTDHGKTSNAVTRSSVPGYERPRGAQVGGQILNARRVFHR
jgi:hypothetical protein